MKPIYTTLFFCLVCTVISAQTTVESDENTVDNIIETIFNNMSEITVTGYTYNGSPEAIGIFQSEGPDFQMGSGMVLGTGIAEEIIGGSGFLSNSYSNDPDLLVYQPGVSLNDCASLEINFTANLSLLELGFVFASTEYPGFTCSNYNDRMGILLKPDTSDQYQIYSLVPTTDIPVSVNSLNSGISADWYDYCDEANPNWQETHIYFVANSNQDANGIVIPGFTVPLAASLPLIVGDSYTLKIAICDAFDLHYNSFVFINSQSVNSAFDCPLLSANIGDECENTGGLALVTPNCSCTPVPGVPEIMLNAELDNNTYTAGDTLQLAVRINNFSTSVYPDYEINIYSALDPMFNPANSALLETYTGEEMAALDSLELIFPISNYNLPVSAQQYYLFVDIPAASGELDATNNRVSLPFSFDDINHVLVSLAPQYAEITLTTGQPGFDFSFNMYNPGPNVLTEALVNLYWSEDIIYNESDLLMHEYQGSDMNINENMTVNLELEVPQPVAQNPYYLLIVPQAIEGINEEIYYAVSKIQFSPLSATHIEKTDWKAFFDKNDALVITPGENVNADYHVSLFDLLGRNVLKERLSSNSGSVKYIPTNGLNTGIYMLKIETGSEMISGKLVLVR